MKNVSDKIYLLLKNRAVDEIMWENNVERGTPHKTVRSIQISNKIQQ
jgi:hypothetical protein